jgi:thiamine biosynthesis lipoprotein
MAKKTDGAFDPTVAALVNFWGFGFEEINGENKTSLSNILNTVGYNKIYIDGDKIVKENPKTQLDFNGIAQGFTVDIIAEHFDKIGIKNYMIEIGGELKCKGRNTESELWRIGIEKPEQKRSEEHFQAILAINDLAVASSGNYRKYKTDTLSGVRYSHSINPKTGQPVKSNLLSVTIINPSCMVADAIATACMIMGLEKSIEYINQDPDTEALIIYSGPNGDRKIFQTEALKEMSIYSSQVKK